MPGEDLLLIANVLAAPAPVPAVPRIEVGTREEIDRHWAAAPLEEHDARLTLVEDVPRLRSGVLETVDVRVENLGGETWRWGGRVSSRLALA